MDVRPQRLLVDITSRSTESTDPTGRKPQPTLRNSIGLVALALAALLTLYSSVLGVGLAAIVLIAWVTAAIYASSRQIALSPILCYLPMFLTYNGLAIWMASDRISTMGYQLVIFGLAAAAFTIGCFPLTLDRAFSPERTDTFGVRTLPTLMLFTVGGGTMLVLFAVSGVPVLAANPNLARVQFFPSGYVTVLAVVPLQIVMVAASLSLVDARRSTALPLAALLAIIAMMLWMTGNRGQLLDPLVSVGLYILWRRRVSVIAMLLVSVAAIGLFAYSGYERNSVSFGPTYDQDLAASGYSGNLRYLAPAALYVAGTSETFDKTINAFPSLYPHPMGLMFFGPLLHQRSADLYLKDRLGYEFVGFGLALGAMNALYLDFDTPGVVAGFLIFGLISTALYRRASARGGLWVVGYCMWMANLLLSNYGHPFAYISVLLVPLGVLGLLRPRQPNSTTVGERAEAFGNPTLSA